MIIETKDIKAGMFIRVHQKITEGDKERTQVYEGMVIKRRGGNGANASFTVRKEAGNWWSEKIFPIQLPTIEKIELKKVVKKRRAQMTFLRHPKFKKKLKDITDKYLGDDNENKVISEPSETIKKEEEVKTEAKNEELKTGAKQEDVKTKAKMNDTTVKAKKKAKKSKSK